MGPPPRIRTVLSMPTWDRRCPFTQQDSGSAKARNSDGRRPQWDPPGRTVAATLATSTCDLPRNGGGTQVIGSDVRSVGGDVQLPVGLLPLPPTGLTEDHAIAHHDFAAYQRHDGCTAKGAPVEGFGEVSAPTVEP